jgi:hypothetical protein
VVAEIRRSVCAAALPARKETSRFNGRFRRLKVRAAKTAKRAKRAKQFRALPFLLSLLFLLLQFHEINHSFPPEKIFPPDGFFPPMSHARLRTGRDFTAELLFRVT